MSPTRSRALKVASRELIEAVGGFEAAALYCRLQKSALQQCCSVASAHVKRFLPIDVVCALEELAGGPEGYPVTRLFLALHGITAVLLPSPGEAAEAVTPALLGKLTKEYCDLSQALCAALADGDCSALDVRKLALVGQCDDLQQVLANMRAAFEGIEAEGAE